MTWSSVRFFNPMRCVQNDMAECYVQNDVAEWLRCVQNDVVERLRCVQDDVAERLWREIGVELVRCGWVGCWRVRAR